MYLLTAHLLQCRSSWCLHPLSRLLLSCFYIASLWLRWFFGGDHTREKIAPSSLCVWSQMPWKSQRIIVLLWGFLVDHLPEFDGYIFFFKADCLKYFYCILNTIIKMSEDRRKIYLSLYLKGLCVRGSWRPNRTATYWPPLLWPSALLSRSPGLPNRGPALCWVLFSLQHHFSISLISIDRTTHFAWIVYPSCLQLVWSPTAP